MLECAGRTMAADGGRPAAGIPGERAAAKTAAIRSRSLKLVSLAALLACGVVAVVAATGELAQAGWPSDFTASFNYYSTDLAPIEATLKHPNANPDQARGLLIPRAAIVAVSEYDAARVPRLPDKIETAHIQLALTYPEGTPLSVRAVELASATGVSQPAALKTLRLEEYLVDLYPAGPGNQWEELTQKSLSRFKVVDEYDGLKHGPADNYFGQAGTDEFVRIHCYPEATPNYFCELDMRVGRGVTALVRFADFRFHGGRLFANERARKLREIACRYVQSPC
jgi:hypothetical protein